MFFSSPSNALKLNKVFDHKDQGIPEKDLLAFQDFYKRIFPDLPKKSISS